MSELINIVVQFFVNSVILAIGDRIVKAVKSARRKPQTPTPAPQPAALEDRDDADPRAEFEHPAALEAAGVREPEAAGAEKLPVRPVRGALGQAVLTIRHLLLPGALGGLAGGIVPALFVVPRSDLEAWSYVVLIGGCTGVQLGLLLGLISGVAVEYYLRRYDAQPSLWLETAVAFVVGALPGLYFYSMLAGASPVTP